MLVNLFPLQAVSVSLPHEADEHEETDGHFGVRRRSESDLESDEEEFDEEDAPRIRGDDDDTGAMLSMPGGITEHVTTLIGGNGDDTRGNRLLEDEENGTPGLLNDVRRRNAEEDDNGSDIAMTEEVSASILSGLDDAEDHLDVIPTRAQIIEGSGLDSESDDDDDDDEDDDDDDGAAFVEGLLGQPGILGQQLLALEGFPPEDGTFLSEDQIPESDHMDEDDDEDEEDEEDEDDDDDDVDEAIREPEVSMYRSYPPRIVETEIQMIGSEILRSGAVCGSNGQSSFYLSIPATESRHVPPSFSSLSNAPEAHVSEVV